MSPRTLLAGLLFALAVASTALAQAPPKKITAADVTELPDGDYVLTKKAGVVTRVVPLDLYTPGATAPTDPMDPPNPPGNLTPFQTEIQKQTKAALAKGGTVTTGAGVSSVYSLAADAINAGTLDVAVAADAVRRGTTAVVNAQKEQAAWAEFSTALDDTITTLRAKGDLKTKAQYVTAFRDISKGMDAATGYSSTAHVILASDPKNIDAAVGLGIFGNIDLAKLIELIKLIVELFKLFSPAALLPMGGM